MSDSWTRFVVALAAIVIFNVKAWVWPTVAGVLLGLAGSALVALLAVYGPKR